ncbi:hypothetical protein ACK3TF_003985 [Chlorella vulgaris]
MYIELHETAGCDEHMPEFSSIREAMFSRLETFDPGFVERIPKFKVSEADRDALQQNAAHFRHWLTTSVQHSLLMHNTGPYLCTAVAWASATTVALVAERVAKHAWQWSERM